MSMLRIFYESFSNRLQRSIPEHLGRYQIAKSWAEEFAGRDKWDLPANVKLSLPDHKPFGELLMDPSQGNLMDLENSVRLHKAMSGLTPIQARDPRLWTRLAHVEFWSYMRKRWPIEKRLADKKRAEIYIKERYYIAASNGRALLRNGIARLWWYSYLTYDERRDNQYELTAILLKNLDITQTILERSMGRSRVVLVGFLEFLMENPTLLEGGDENRGIIRSLAIALNFFGGIALLDCLSATAIKSQLANDLEKIIAYREASSQSQIPEKEFILQNG